MGRRFNIDEEMLRQFMAFKKGGGFDFDFDFGPAGVGFNFSDRQGRRRRSSRARMFDSGELRLVILALVAEEDRHGYDIISVLEEKTGGLYAPSPGTVYPTFQLLEEMALIESKGSQGKKRLYGITSAGKAYLAEREDDIARLMARLEDHGEQRKQADARPIKPAVKRLIKAFMVKMAETSGDEETLQKVGKIIDKAAKKIEKL